MFGALGWVGSICFSICAVPQAYSSIKQGHSNGISWLFLILWFIGEVCTIIYVLPKLDYPLLLNYTGNMLCLLVMIRYKLSPRG
jgi:uncharacterized protein with PQ loop repeat